MILLTNALLKKEKPTTVIIAKNAALRGDMLKLNAGDAAKAAECGAMKLHKNGKIIRANTVRTDVVPTTLCRPLDDPWTLYANLPEYHVLSMKWQSIYL